LSGLFLSSVWMLQSRNGPGRLNKFYDTNRVNSLVQYSQPKGTKLRIGRPLFENHSNPYQFDMTFVNRLDHAKRHVMDKLEETMVSLGRSRSVGPPSSGASDVSKNSRGHHRVRVERQSAVNVEGSIMNASLGLNSLQAVPTDMPGYEGYVPGRFAENIYGLPHSKVSIVSAQTRSYGRDFNGSVGQIRLPKPWIASGTQGSSSYR